MTKFINLRHFVLTSLYYKNRPVGQYFKIYQDIDIHIIANDPNSTSVTNVALDAINCIMINNKINKLDKQTLSELTAEQIKELMAIYYTQFHFNPNNKFNEGMLELNEADIRQAVDEFIDITDLSLIITRNTPLKTNISTAHQVISTAHQVISTAHQVISTAHQVISTAHIMERLNYTREHSYTEKQLNIVKQHIEYIRSRITLHELAKTQEQAQEQA